MKTLELNKLYKGKVGGIVIPGLTQEQITEFFASGRQCGVMLEGLIANQFDGCDTRTQGEGADIMWNGKKIQCKTANFRRSKPHLMAKHRAGGKRFWTSKSGLFDTTIEKYDSPRHDGAWMEECNKYYDHYDYFMIIDITKMDQSEYSFIVVESKDLKEKHVKGRIAWTDLKGI